MEHDVLARALSAIAHAEVKGKAEVVVKPASKTIITVLEILKRENYIGSYEFLEDKKGGMVKIALVGKINGIGAIKPRYPVTVSDYDAFEMSYLPAKDFGRLIVSTSKGCITHIEAKQKKLGGLLLAYVY